MAAHAVVGCASAAASGGECGAGALSAGFSKLGTIAFDGYDRGIGGLIASSVMGGTVSVLGGGKFANGAVTGAFGYLYNFLLHKRTPINRNGWGSDSYEIEFENDPHAQELGWLGKGPRLLGFSGAGPFINIVRYGQDLTQTITCAGDQCYGSRNLSGSDRVKALSIEPRLRNVAGNMGYDLQYLNQDQARTLLNAWQSIPGFTRLYGTTDNILRNFK